jgi:hypothetical protein
MPVKYLDLHSEDKKPPEGGPATTSAESNLPTLQEIEFARHLTGKACLVDRLQEGVVAKVLVANVNLSGGNSERR